MGLQCRGDKERLGARRRQPAVNTGGLAGTAADKLEGTSQSAVRYNCQMRQSVDEKLYTY